MTVTISRDSGSEVANVGIDDWSPCVSVVVTKCKDFTKNPWAMRKHCWFGFRPVLRLTPIAIGGVVQDYVLEGQYHSNGQVFGLESYRPLPAQQDVSPMTTESGVTILMMYDPVGK